MHRHQYKGRKLGRKAAPRKALMRNLASQVILYESVTTTLAKAKEVRPILEKLITRAKTDTVQSRRAVARYLSNNDKSLAKLFEELGPLYRNRNGGYLRIVKTVNRKGDNAPMAIVQLLDTDKLTKKEAESNTKHKTQNTKSVNTADKKDKPSVADTKSGTKSKAAKVAKKKTVKDAAAPTKGGSASGGKKPATGKSKKVEGK